MTEHHFGAGADNPTMRMRELQRNKVWQFEGVSKQEVEDAIRRAGATMAPLDHGPLPWPARKMMKMFVGASCHDVADPSSSTYAKRSRLGRLHYETELRVVEQGDTVQVERKSVGLLAPAAQLTNAGRAIEAEIKKKRQRKLL